MSLTIVTLITFFVLALTLVMGLAHVPWSKIATHWALALWLLEIAALYWSLIVIIVKSIRSKPETLIDASSVGGTPELKKHHAIQFPLRRPICNVTAAIQPFALFILCIPYHYHILHKGFSGYGSGLEFIAVFVFFSIPLGLLLSVISLYRNERFPILTLIELMGYTILSFLTRPLFC